MKDRKMWFYCVLMMYIFLAPISSASDKVDVECITSNCDVKGENIVVGDRKNVKLKFTVVKEGSINNNIAIKYDGKLIFNAAPSKMEIYSRGRFHFGDEKVTLTDGSKKYFFTFTLTKVDSTKDKSKQFTYAGSVGGQSGGPFKGALVLDIRASYSPFPVWAIIIIVIVAVALVTALILFILYKQGIVPTEACRRCCKCFKGGSTRIPTEESKDQTAIQITTTNPSETVYAELGPGGNLGPRATADISNYAEVKVDEDEEERSTKQLTTDQQRNTEYATAQYC